MNIHIPTDFTLNELRAFIENDEGEPPEGYYTAREWATRFKIHIRKMRVLLKQAKDRGLLDMIRMPSEALDGKTTRVPFYALKRLDEEEGGGDV